ncbi:MAG: nucleoside deaminase [Pseudothermotoga sp.]
MTDVEIEVIELCLEALRAGCFPVGSVITDGQGKIISRGRNTIHDTEFKGYPIFGNSIAHAELNALASMKRIPDDLNVSDYIIYASMEPCVMCFGAIYMSGIKNVVYGMKDNVGGGLNLYGVTEYYSRKKINIAQSKELEKIQSVLIGFLCDKNYVQRAGFWQTYLSMYPQAFEIAQQLRRDGFYEKILANELTTLEFIEAVERSIKQRSTIEI